MYIGISSSSLAGNAMPNEKCWTPSYIAGKVAGV